jgi:glucose/arabinose dehydrogenase
MHPFNISGGESEAAPFPAALSARRHKGKFRGAALRQLTGSLLVFFASLALAPAASAQITRVPNTSLTLPQNPQVFGYATEDAFTGLTFTLPVGLVTPPGETGRLFVVEESGAIQVVTGIPSAPVKSLFLDLTSRVLYTTSEEGVLGLAFHPNFATNHYFYVFYTTTTTTNAGTNGAPVTGRHDQLSRFTAPPGATNAQILATEVPMISQYDEATNHNAGDLHFGSDGYLYVSLGDEGGANGQYGNCQLINRDFFSGLLRIDVDQLPENLEPNAHPSVHPGTYKVPADNPFVGATSFNGLAVDPSGVRTEFWAVGLRNPWRFSFDAPTGRLLLGDVGQGAREEIDLITRGGNYGWNFREGTIAGPQSDPPPGASFTDPIWDADRTLAQAIIGGVVYRGGRLAQLYGQYVFGDSVLGKIYTMSFPVSGPVQVTLIASESSPAAFGVDPSNGDILVANVGSGTVRRLVYDSTATGTPLPATLSATGAFADLATLTPAAGVVNYEPNLPSWSDYATKRHFFSVPAVTDKITFSATGGWTFPAGTIWVNHLELDLTRGDPSTARRIETRFLVKTASGVYGVTYRWNSQQTEATLVPEEGTEDTFMVNEGGTVVPQTWHYPSRSECMQCHSPVAGHALGFNTPQLNGSHVYDSGTANQLTVLANAGYFATATVPDPGTLQALAPPSDTGATLEHRVRSYLTANCVECHQPGGAAQSWWDARITTPTGSAGLINGPLVNLAGNPANRVIAAGDLAHSMLLTRISERGPGQMPPLDSGEIDPDGVNLFTAWINDLGRPSDFNADGHSDILWENTATGDRAIWYLNGTDIDSFGYLAGIPTEWTIVATADFDGDGQTDILWEDTSTGDRSIWLMNGTNILNFAYLAYVDPVWHIAAVGDFNGDGNADVIWENTSTGDRAIWFLNGTGIDSFGYIAGIPTDWHVVGTGDFDGDGQTDLVWENLVTGDRTIWYMNGATLSSFGYIANIPGAWHIASVMDIDGDGHADLVWENTSTGDRAVWLMNNATQLSAPYLANVDPVWRIAP